MSTSDFFNNAAAVSVALLFTKIVSHNLKVASHDRQGRVVPNRWRCLHVAAVLAAAIALTAALFVSFDHESRAGWHWAVWIPLVISGAILVADELFHDVSRLKKRGL